MSNKIAVEPCLSDVKRLLETEGYNVVDLSNTGNVTAIVLTGLDNNTMNMQNISTKAPVIEASGLTPEQVVSRIKQLS